MRIGMPKLLQLFRGICGIDRLTASSSEIIKHGNPFFAFTCDRCGCEFKTKITDCHRKEVTFERAIEGTDTWIPDVLADYYTFCPECNFRCWNDGKAKP